MLEAINDLLWSKVLIAALIALGLAFTIVSRFVQFRYFLQMFAIVRQAFHHEAGHLSSFQALALSVAGRVGAGNIAGVAVALTLGGPGAIFWMWIVGLVGMATSYFECTLAQVFKNAEPDGTYRGGPAYYMERALRQRWMAMLFSVLLLVTFGFAFCALQSYTVATSLDDAFGIPPYASGIGLVVILGLIIFGGVKRIADVAEIVVPVMAIGYFVMAIVVILLKIDEIPAVFATIFRSAFGLEPAFAGGMGAAILLGVKRGLFSNEAGLGSAPNVAAVAFIPHPGNQGIVQSFSVFIDTLIMCTCTAVIILLSGVLVPGGSDVGGVAMTQSALAAEVGEWGRSFVSVALLLFAFTSIMYNYYLGENSLNFFSGENKTLFTIYRIFVLALVLWGAMQDLSTVFSFADVTMGLLALVNLAALALLFKIGLRVMKDFDRQFAAGEKPVFDPAKFPDLDIDPEAWPAEKAAAVRSAAPGT
ncbi:MAG: alanine:cation symporter family protein [Rhodospirillales bacterium]|nr:alanine:cation symporter family protein [Rhodospirillales bacterium]